MAKLLIPVAFVLSLPFAAVCSQSEGTPPDALPGALPPTLTTANTVVDDEIDATIRDSVSAAVAVRHEHRRGIQSLKSELEGVIAVRDAANKSAKDIEAKLKELEAAAANDEEQQIALLVEAFRQLLRSRLGESLDEKRSSALTLELAIQYRNFYTDMIARLRSSDAALDSALSVELRGPDEVLVGETAEYEIVVTNKGESELTGVRIVYRADESLLPRRASENYRVESGSLVWTIGVLAPGEAKSLTVHCDTARPNSSAATRVLCNTDQGVTNSKGLNTAIRPPATPGVTSAGTPRTGTGIATSR
jgi:hypothetical protein